MSDFDELVKRLEAEMWAMGQVGSGVYETRIIRQGPRAYTEYTQRALQLQAELRRLTEERLAETATSEEEQPGKEGLQTLWEHLDDER